MLAETPSLFHHKFVGGPALPNPGFKASSLQVHNPYTARRWNRNLCNGRDSDLPPRPYTS